MSTETKIPDVKIIDSIAPEIDGADRLVSPQLGRSVLKFGHFEGDIWDAFLNAPDGSVEEEHFGQELASLYFLKTANRMDISNDKSVTVAAFNEFATEKYGKVDPAKARNLMRQELNSWQKAPDSTAKKVYARILEENSNSDNEDAEILLPLHELQQALFEANPEIVSAIDKLGNGPYSPVLIRAVYRNILRALGKKDERWKNWKVTNPDTSSNLSTNSEKEEIRVPDSRSPIKDKQELLALTLHEIGVHAVRCVNGWKTGDKLIAVSGLPGNLNFEEALGKFAEFLTTGVQSETAFDRYIDIGLASGAIDGHLYTRDEIIALAISRSETRARASGKPVDSTEKALLKATKSANRIFRGGDAVPIRAENGTVLDQAVFTKDISYYADFRTVEEYIDTQLKAGYSPPEILQYLLSGKINPTKASHIEYAAEHGIQQQKSLPR